MTKEATQIKVKSTPGRPKKIVVRTPTKSRGSVFERQLVSAYDELQGNYDAVLRSLEQERNHVDMLDEELSNARILLAHVKSTALGRLVVRRASRRMPAAWSQDGRN